MAATSKSFTLIRGRRMRVTRLDACGAKVSGADSTIVSSGFITVGLSPQFEEGTDISVTNAAGELCILDTPSPQFTGYEVEVEFCGVNPDLIRVMTGSKMVMDASTPAVGVGFRTNSKTDKTTIGWALEVWSTVPSGACTGGSASYGYFLIPFISGGNVGDLTIGNDAINVTVTGASSKDGTAWGVGPYNVVGDATGVASPLQLALDAYDHLHMQLTSIEPPAVSDGALALGVPATGATQGSPAVLAPANSYAPKDLASATPTSPTPTPSSAWTAGNFIRLGDGTKATWNGTAWVATT